MDTTNVFVGTISVHLGTEGKRRNQKVKGEQAGSLGDAGQTQEPEAVTGSLDVGAIVRPQNAARNDAQWCRFVRFSEPVERVNEHRMCASDSSD